MCSAVTLHSSKHFRAYCVHAHVLMLLQVSQVTYTRRLAVASGDTELDQAIVPGDMSVLWSFNTASSNTQHAFSNRGEELGIAARGRHTQLYIDLLMLLLLLDTLPYCSVSL
jgi:hypothetical protein